MTNLNVIVIHRLPGRIRLKLNRPPNNIKQLLHRVIKHEGIKKISFNPISKSLLAQYTPSLISSTEILLRVSIALSIEFGSNSVKLDIKRNTIPMSPIDYYSGVSIGIAMLTKLLKLPVISQGYLNYNAGISTTLSVLKHAYKEVKHEGIYDPEVVSVVYLINSLINGNFLLASAVTWIATFGRHLLEAKEESCLLKAMEVKGDEDKSYMDVEVHPIVDHSAKTYPVKVMIQGLSKIIGLKPVEHIKLMENIKRVSRAHHDVLEGVGNNTNPVYMRIEY